MDSKTFTRHLALLGVLAAGSAYATSPPYPDVLEAGHTAVWFDSENPGTGWVLEMLREDRAAAYWYGFNDEGQPIWRFGAGGIENDPLEGTSLVFDDLYEGSGARFGGAFDPNDVVLERVGSAKAKFASCDIGSIGVTLGADRESETLDRLTQTMGAGCAPINGTPGFPVKSYAGQSGAWYDPDRNGEGITLQWMARDEAVLYWFTYDLEGNPFWLFGVGAEEDGAIVFPVLHSAERLPGGEVQLTEWGSLALDLECKTGTLAWASMIEGFGEGSRDLKRLNTLASPACPTVRPKLTDLYDIEVTAVPLNEQLGLLVLDVADDGTVLGISRIDGTNNTPWVLSPEPGAEWVSLGGPSIQGGWPVDVSQSVFLSLDATHAVAGVDWQDGNVQPAIFTRDDSSVVPEFGPGVFGLVGASANRTVLTGRNGDSQPWAWNPVTGVRALPLLHDPEAGIGVAVAAADDGSRIVGVETVPRIGTPPPEAGVQPGTQALAWDREGNASLMRDPEGFVLAEPGACSAGCNTVFGARVVGVPHDSPRKLNPWFWTADGRFGEFKGFDFTLADGRPNWDPEIRDSSADGTIALGYARSMAIVSPALPPAAFLWTQATEVVVLGDVLLELGLDEPHLPTGSFSARALSNDGRRVLFWLNGNAYVLTLNPKVP